MTITLPDTIKDEVEAKARKTGLPSVEAYILWLIVGDDPGAEDDLLPADFVGPAELTPKSREDLERMIDEGVNSGPGVVADAAFWSERRRVLRERMAAKGRGEVG